MSKENVKQMFEKFQKDTELQNKYFLLMQEHHKTMEKALAGDLVEFGKAEGFIFSKDDLLAARAELMDTNNAGGELSDNDLASVAGGSNANSNKGIIIGSIVTVGIGCGFFSICVELYSDFGPGACGSGMTTVNCPR